ncbi:MAG: putative serine/threonine protein kinase [Actinomycetia bacterium]|nr:putative serine/threonine protein kinase [Actinomycetes bacterium]
MRCEQAGCGGTIDGGYCDTCGMAPHAAKTGSAKTGSAKTGTAASTRTGSMAVLSTRTGGSARTGSTHTGSRRRLGAGLVDVAPLPPRDPASAVMTVAAVREERRYCGACGDPVGRGRDGKPGRTAGFCPSCGGRFDFAPKLAPGDLVGGQYEIAGAIAHGGLGWIYLATDHNVSDRWVVLKGLLNSTDEDATAAAVAERRFLAEVEHPHIVKIYNFVEHDGAGYIVMEYVGGPSLKDILKDRREANNGQPSPLPLAQALAYVLEIMPAFGYLHERGLLFCDFKPDNVIQTDGQVKLIDLGGVVRIGDDNAAFYGTVGFQAPEIAEVGPSIPSDLYTIGRTLAVLATDFRGYQSTFAASLPDRSEVPLYREHESFYRLLEKATHIDPGARFTSAAEMADQLVGVLRQVLAAGGSPAPAPSALFTGELRAETRTDAPQWRHLPAPLTDLADPSAAFLASLTVTDPGEVLTLLAKAPEQSMEVRLRALRARIDEGAAAAWSGGADPAGPGGADLAGPGGADPFALARAAVAAALAEAGNDWRIAWYDGVLALAEGDYPRAEDQFQAVWSCLPGELAPQLAIALTRELAGDHPGAAGYYDLVSRADPAFTTAHSGLARCRLAAGDRSGAVEAYNRVPGTSAAYRTAQVAAVRALLHRATTNGTGSSAAGHAGGEAMVAAAGLIERLEVTSAQLAALRAELLDTALAALAAGSAVPGSVLGSGRDPALPAGERDVRFALEDCYRELARSESGRARIALVDRANAIRPRTRF